MFVFFFLFVSPTLSHLKPLHQLCTQTLSSTPANNRLGVWACAYHAYTGKRDQTCACIVGHLNKQIRKLWENPDKQNHLQNGLKQNKFDADMDRSTSSESGW